MPEREVRFHALPEVSISAKIGEGWSKVGSNELECTEYVEQIETDTPVGEPLTTADVLKAHSQVLAQAEMVLLEHIRELMEARYDPAKLAQSRSPIGLG